MSLRIITQNIFPPIPDRSHDWVAYYDGHEEDGDRGYGRTEQEAIRDLEQNYDVPDRGEGYAAQLER